METIAGIAMETISGIAHRLNGEVRAERIL
jgi:hypothetical protein